MAHIDEGTIHAWLDGALPPDEGARLQAHIAACTDCSAAVAEARGLIAASSRILAALDDVPAGVIPRAGDAATSRPDGRANAGDIARGDERAGARATGDAEMPAPPTPSAIPTPEPPRVSRDAVPRRRPWYLRPQFAAAAGIAFVAISATFVMRETGRGSMADFQRPAPAEGTSEARSDAAPVAASTAAPSATDSFAAASREAGRSLLRDAPPAPAPRGASPSAPTTVATAPAGSPGAAVAAGAAREAELKAAPVAADTLPARRLALDADRITSAERARVSGDVAVQQKREGAAPPAAAEASAPRGAAKALAAAPSGAAPVAPPATRPAPERGAPQPAAPAPDRREAGNLVSAPSAVTAVEGCYRLEPSQALRLAGAGERWRLEPVPAGREDGRDTFLARDLSADEAARGARDAAPTATGGWRWEILPTGGVVLIRGTGATATRYPLSIAPEGAATNRAARQERAASDGATIATRITCPPR